MADPASSRTSKTTNTFEPSPAAVEILRALAFFHYLSVDQIMRLFYKPSTITTLRPRLTALTAHGYCERRPLPMPPLVRAGSAPFLYSLGAAGRAFAQAQGWEVPARFRPSELAKPSQRPHVVACSDVAVAAYLLAAHDPRVTLERLYVERVLRGKRGTFEVAGRPCWVTPDAAFSLQVSVAGRRQRHPFIVEVDLATERQTHWRKKIQGLLGWFDAPYATLFGTRSGTFAVISPGRPNHAAVLRHWTEAALVACGRAQDADLFLFTGVNPALVTPTQLFLAPVWHQPFSETAVPALDLEVAGG